jgi:hypothetical protein
MKLTPLAICASLLLSAPAFAQSASDFRVLATNKTSTMEKELNEAAEAGFQFVSVMGGETAFGGKEVVALMQKRGPAAARFAYRLLAANRTSTLQRELQEASDDGYLFVGQTVFESLFGGKEVAVILERDKDNLPQGKYEYKLVATSRTSTLQRELGQLGAAGYEALAMTVGQTALGGSEIVVIARKLLR